MLISNLLQELKILINLQFINAMMRLKKVKPLILKKTDCCEENLHTFDCKHNHL